MKANYQTFLMMIWCWTIQFFFNRFRRRSSKLCRKQLIAILYSNNSIDSDDEDVLLSLLRKRKKEDTICASMNVKRVVWRTRCLAQLVTFTRSYMKGNVVNVQIAPTKHLYVDKIAKCPFFWSMAEIASSRFSRSKK